MPNVTPLSFCCWCLVVLGCLAGPTRAQGAAPDDKPFTVKTIKDVDYYTGPDQHKVKHKLDLYLPDGARDFPVLFFVHGGAWKSGDKSLYAPLGQRFAGLGIGTVVISYRLSPKVQHPAHVQDVARAFAWTKANVGKYGGKADEVFVCGHSAGGHLVALLATDDSYLKAQKCSVSDIKGVIPLSGVYEVTPRTSEAAFGKDKEACQAASPVEHVKEKPPPFLIGYGDNDYPAFDTMAEQLCAALKAAKGEAATVKAKDRNHISLLVQLFAAEDDPLRSAVLAFIAGHSGWKMPARPKP